MTELSDTDLNFLVTDSRFWFSDFGEKKKTAAVKQARKKKKTENMFSSLETTRKTTPVLKNKNVKWQAVTAMWPKSEF